MQEAETHYDYVDEVGRQPRSFVYDDSSFDGGVLDQSDFPDLEQVSLSNPVDTRLYPEQNG